ncbi:N-acetyl-gamma-glutamyl-phosphate reductase [Lyngbya confervoides]|uniref:N-acetyl-gamma-glutamyl-phosphate reductase n=1 Tax=Lyngbya confervoides BDU141951 TaxID=1574623 RepID=A0ABD4T464_9CYAN|nr:N-acetyl-gamma-glutamyl-phosphate reductase [Lyngbya confervoides]MCM1983461.1 N-acetyl-gamma-glutamyl-phosphate reductase [Lyngbya confervoides BDU141951]
MGTESKLSVAIVGASGYGGVQLVRLLHAHPRIALTYLGGNSSAGRSFTDLYPQLAPFVDQVIEPIDLDVIAERAKVVFLALPNGLAQGMAPTLLEKGCIVFDLSADYRFRNLQTYETWYKSARSDHSVAQEAVYGLPELFRDRIATANLIGCPGCYPTASLLALAPLLKQGLIQLESVVIDAKSGTSGGGRQEKLHLLHSECDNTLSAYGIAHHRHTPEIEEVASTLAGQNVILQFTPHLIPMTRGILATVYCTMRDPGLVREDILTIYRAFYRQSPWVRLLPSGIYPSTKWAWGTNACYLGIELDERTGRVIVLSAIDNLMKGQAGQALQALNLRMGWDETEGLPDLSFYP